MCNSSPTNVVPLLEARLSDLDRTAIDVGGGGDCFFRAVSHQLYGNFYYYFLFGNNFNFFFFFVVSPISCEN